MDAASNLAATSRVIPLYSIFALMGLVPTRNNNRNVIQSLMTIIQDINPDTLHRHEEIIVHELRRLMWDKQVHEHAVRSKNDFRSASSAFICG